MINEKMKKMAVSILKKLDVYEPYIKGFEEKGDACLFEQFGGYWAYQYPELVEKIKELEKDGKNLVYAITHEFTSFGELYDFCLITKNEEEWEYLTTNGQKNDEFYCFSYVWNKSCDDCSEYGDIYIKCFGGGICRIA